MNSTKEIIIRQMLKQAIKWSNEQVAIFKDYEIDRLVELHYDAQSDLIDLIHDFLRKELEK